MGRLHRHGLIATATVAATAALAPTAAAQCDETMTLPVPGAAAYDAFGLAVALDGDRALVGASTGEFSATGIGRAIVYAHDGAAWSVEQTLTASDGEPGDYFGAAAALQGDVVVIGAPNEDEAGDNAGAAYVFRREAGTWSEVQKLTASDAAPAMRFGNAVAVDGDALLVGAQNANAVYVFRFDGSQWAEQQTLVPPAGAGTTSFGHDVAIDGDVVVGGGVLVAEDFSAWWGAAHVFRLEGASSFHEQQILVPAVPASGFFGVPVAVDGDTVLVGAFLDPTHGVASGSTAVYRYQGAAWALEDTIFAPSEEINDLFGCDVALDGDTALVGSRGDDATADGAGAVHLFRRNGRIWSHEQVLYASDGTALDGFGAAVALAGPHGLVGAPLADPAGMSSGAAYAFACSLIGACTGDIDGDGDVAVGDLVAVILQWGPCSGPDCPADINGDDVVDVVDLVAVILAWGFCP